MIKICYIEDDLNRIGEYATKVYAKFGSQIEFHLVAIPVSAGYNRIDDHKRNLTTETGLRIFKEIYLGDPETSPRDEMPEIVRFITHNKYDCVLADRHIEPWIRNWSPVKNPNTGESYNLSLTRLDTKNRYNLL